MRASAFAALGLAAYSVFLVATIPAAYVASQVNAALPGRIELADAHGTLWRGEARLRIAPSRGGPTLDRVEWRFAPARLATGEIAFDVQAQGRGLQARGQAARGFTQWRLREASLEADAGGAALWLPWVAPWQPTGRVLLSAPSVSAAGSELRGTAELEWRNAATSLSTVRPLGSYRAAWRGESGSGTVEVTTLQGPLRVSGRGTTSPAGMAFNGEARADAASAQDLEPLLNLMGPRRPDGARALQVRIP